MKIKIGISSCLLGEKVRYDGGHKHDAYLSNTLGAFFEYVSVCPEYEAGFGIPREAMRLVGAPDSPRLMTQKSGIDMTGRLEKWITKKLKELEEKDLCGFIFKSGSPSSGMERVKVYDSGGNARKSGSGLFAKAFMDRFSLIPVEDEGRLHDANLRENFIVRVFAFKRWKDLRNSNAAAKELIEFHAQHKYLLMAHSPAVLKELGKLVASQKKIGKSDFFQRYETLFMKALKQLSTVKKNANVLMHMAGYFRERLLPEEKKELFEVIELYRTGIVPLILPVTLIKHYVRVYGEEYLAGQCYIDPHPIELKLRNHA